MENAISYIRYSSVMQDDHSLDTQKAKIEEAATKNGDRIAEEDWYSDVAETGTTPDRTNFMRMIKDLKSGKKKGIKKVYVYKFSRFMRDNRESQYFKMQLEAVGVDVISALEPLPDEKYMADFIEGMIELTDKLQSATIGIHVLDGMEELAKKKYWVGGPPPFGYRIKKIDDREGYTSDGELVKRAILVPDEREAPIVRRAFELSVSTGWGGHRIYAKLCEEAGCKILGRPRRRRDAQRDWVIKPASPIGGRGINDILRKRIYKGIYLFNSGGYQLAYNDNPNIDRRMRRKRIQKPKGEHVEVFVDEWRLVSDELWEKAQQNRLENTRSSFGGRAKRAAFALSGLIVCGICGKRVAGHWQENRDGSNRYYYYRCRSSMNGDICCSNKARVRGLALESAIIAAIETDLFSKKFFEALFGMIENAQNATNCARQDRATLSRLRADLTAEINALIELATKAPDIREIADKIAEREHQRRRIDEEIAGADQPMPNRADLRSRVQERMGKTLSLLKTAEDVAELRVELSRWIEIARLDADGEIYVQWKSKPIFELLKINPALKMGEEGTVFPLIQNHFDAFHRVPLAPVCGAFSGFSGLIMSGLVSSMSSSGFSGFSGAGMSPGAA